MSVADGNINRLHGELNELHGTWCEETYVGGRMNKLVQSLLHFVNRGVDRLERILDLDLFDGELRAVAWPRNALDCALVDEAEWVREREG